MEGHCGLDRENVSEYNIEITATDSGSPPLSSKKIIPVSITDVNDNPPVFSQPSYNVYLKENGVPGSILYSVSASDLDFGENAKISYSILDSKATDASLFTVNLYTGEVRTKRAMSEQDDSSQRLLIEVKDDGEPVQSATVTVSILLEDGLHEPILDLRHKAAEPSKKTGRITLYLILSLASVSVLSLVTFFILAVKCMRNSRKYKRVSVSLTMLLSIPLIGCER
uniref:Cadherin domain-containing protein n=1 Tax=Dicentrarchus labrax TaxID=13489 RepID=A0A8P4GD12_DICLA